MLSQAEEAALTPVPVKKPRRAVSMAMATLNTLAHVSGLPFLFCC